MISNVYEGKMRERISRFRGVPFAGWAFRVVALVVLAIGFLGLCSFEVPAMADMSDLVKAAHGGEVSEVYVRHEGYAEFRVFWSSGYLRDYEATYKYEHPVAPVTQEVFVADVRNRMGGEGKFISFKNDDRFDEIGFIDFFLPVLHWRVMPYFAWPVAFFCVVALVGIISRSGLRSESAGYWLLLSLVFGFGFPAYYWSEPRPLIQLRKDRVDHGSVMTARRVVGATACWAVLGGAVIAVFVLRR
ncbi:hypothetical protein [Streptomyces sp. TS71-3]|uniref:hypothetical protein n=1 Tax=Streptomyces sp. TS71-3 TaxID=2733862 RepID=UPI001BB408F7|nr:hypothetical protein [Streptomyces sp. TS71-3]